MFQHDENLEFVDLPVDSISALYQSANTAPVVLAGRAPAPAGAVIVGYREADGQYGVLLALHLISYHRTFVLTHVDEGLDATGARDAAREAIAVLESMGFRVKDGGWKDLAPSERLERMKSLKVFRAPEGATESPRLIVLTDPALDDATPTPAIPPPAAPAVVGGHPAASTTGDPLPSAAPGSPPVVLLLDADKSNRLMVRAALRVHGFEVYEASLCSEAEELGRRVKFDLIAVAGTLPDGPGFDFISRLRQKDQSVRVVFSSEHPTFFRDPRNRNRLMREFDVSATLQKSVSPGGVAEKIISILEERR